MEIKQIRDINEALEILWTHDQNSQQINFPKDAPQRNLFEQRIKREYSEQPEGFFFVYDEEQKVIGSLILRIQFNPYRKQKYGDVRAIYLEESCRGKGFGSRLLDFADEYFKRKDCSYAFAGIAAYNPFSNSLFAKKGYTHTRTILEKAY